MVTGHQQQYASQEDWRWKRARAYQPAPELVFRMERVFRDIGCPMPVYGGPSEWITSDEDLITRVIRFGEWHLRAQRGQSTVKETTRHARMAQGELVVRLLEAGVTHPLVSWGEAGSRLSLAHGTWTWLPRFDAIAVALSAIAPAADRFARRAEIGHALMERAVAQAVDRVTATDPGAQWVEFATALYGIVMDPETDWAAIAAQDLAAHETQEGSRDVA